MVYFANNSVAPSMVAGGAQSYQNPYYKSTCGCGASNNQVTNQASGPVREGFTAGHPAAAHVAAVPLQASRPAPSCTLTATAPPAGCCNPAPLHCSTCDGSGFFRASEAYGS